MAMSAVETRYNLTERSKWENCIKKTINRSFQNMSENNDYIRTEIDISKCYEKAKERRIFRIWNFITFGKSYSDIRIDIDYMKSVMDQNYAYGYSTRGFLFSHLNSDTYNNNGIKAVFENKENREKYNIKLEENRIKQNKINEEKNKLIDEYKKCIFRRFQNQLGSSMFQRINFDQCLYQNKIHNTNDGKSVIEKIVVNTGYDVVTIDSDYAYIKKSNKN